LMREPEHAIARVDVLHDDADAEHVDDLVQVHVLAQHLLVDAVEMLLAARDARLDAGGRELVDESLLDAPQRLPLRAAGAAQGSLEHAVAERIERSEAQVLELDLEAVDAEPIRDRRIDLERL